MLSSRFRSANILRSDRPLNDDQIMRYARLSLPLKRMKAAPTVTPTLRPAKY